MKKVRDTTLSAEAYRVFIERYEGHVRHALSLGEPTLFDEAARYTLEIVKAMYSAGTPVPDCLAQLNKMATFDFRYIDEGRKYSFGGIGEVDTRFVERFPAAHLVGRASELITAHRRSTFEYAHLPWQAALVDPICEVLAGDPVVQSAGTEATIRKAIKYYAAIPRLCKTVADHDAAAFASTLEEFLREGWKPLIEKRSRLALKEKPQEYSGTWCFLAAALCKIMGGVPAVPEQLVRYIPLDLL